LKQKTPQFAGLFFPKITQRASRISGDPVRVLFHHLFDETERVSLGLEKFFRRNRTRISIAIFRGL
jgi:hypothetical protein